MDLVEKVGYVVEYDKDQLGNAIYTLLNDDNLRKKFGEEGRKLVKDQFNWDVIVKKVEDIHVRL